MKRLLKKYEKIVQDFAEIRNVAAPHFEDEQPHNWDCWFSKIDGAFICPADNCAEFNALLERGIINLQKSHLEGRTACIGFNPSEQKWYGWSHRAIFGFGIGDKIGQGYCGYKARNEKEEVDRILLFWKDDEFEENVSHVITSDEGGNRGLQITWTYKQSLPNKKLRGTVGCRFVPFGELGKGEWIAETIEDAKQMAIDFAMDVS